MCEPLNESFYCVKYKIQIYLNKCNCLIFNLGNQLKTITKLEEILCWLIITIHNCRSIVMIY